MCSSALSLQREQQRFTATTAALIPTWGGSWPWGEETYQRRFWSTQSGNSLETPEIQPGSRGVAGPIQARLRQEATVDARNRLVACAVLEKISELTCKQVEVSVTLNFKLELCVVCHTLCLFDKHYCLTVDHVWSTGVRILNIYFILHVLMYSCYY